MIKITKIISLFVLVCSLSACNTMVGLGQDLQNLGRTMESSGSKVAPKNDTNSGVVVTPIK